MKLIIHQILAVTPVLLTKFMTGLGAGWIPPMLHYLRQSPEAAFTSEQCSWIASGHYITRGFCPFLIIMVIDRFGRNITLILSTFICFVMWIAVYYSQSFYVHYAVRLAFGIGVGFCEAAASIYIAENCSSNLRGIFSGLCSTFFYIGELAAFLLAGYLSYEWNAIGSAILGFLVILSTFLLKEPAHYLIMKGNLTMAEKNYDYLHNLQKSETKFEFQDIKQYVDEVKNRKFSWKVIRSKEASKSLRIVLVTNFLSLGGGFTAVNSFMTMALEGSEDLSTSQLTILIGVAQLVCVSLMSPFMDTFNRRTLYLISSALMSMSHAGIAALYYASLIIEVPYFSWLLFISFTTFLCVDAMFMAPLTSAISGELLPLDLKAMGSSLAVVTGSLGGFLGAAVFLPISDAFGIHISFIMFSFLNLFTFVYVYFDLPETKGKTLIEIQRELKGDEKPKESPKIILERTRL